MLNKVRELIFGLSLSIFDIWVLALIFSTLPWWGGLFVGTTYMVFLQRIVAGFFLPNI